MKKVSVLIVAIMLCITVLAACGGSGASGSGSGGVTVEETTILDEQGIKAVVKGFGAYENEMLSLNNVLLTDVTNNTEKAISFGFKNCSVNGYMMESHYFVTVEPGKTATYPAAFEEEEFKDLGITTCADYEFCINVEDNETNETLIETKPISVKTSAYENYEYNFDESGTVLYDAGGVKIIAKGIVESDFFGDCVSLYVSNQSDLNISVTAIEALLNGKNVDAYLGAEVCAGKHSIDLLSFDEKDRPEKIESLTLSFMIGDMDTYETIVEKTEPADVRF